MRCKRTRRAGRIRCADDGRSARYAYVAPVRVVGHASAGGADSYRGRRGRWAEVACAHFFVAFVGARVGLARSCLEGTGVGGDREPGSGRGWAAGTVCRCCFERACEIHCALPFKGFFASAHTDLARFARGSRASSRRADSEALALEPDGEDAADDAEGTGLDHASSDMLGPSHTDIDDALKGKTKRACGERVYLVGEGYARGGDIGHRVSGGMWLLEGGLGRSLGSDSEAS